MRQRISRGLIGISLLLLALGLVLSPGGGRAQADSRTFPETGFTVQGRFLAYWDAHGGLAQQGYPISPELQEPSDLDPGQNYTVQYFERAVFEYHPDNPPPYDILLTRLGALRYQATYGPAGAPGQQASADNARFFPETGQHLGGKFRAYWESHGGLAQQGYPISEEFQEVSALDGKPYAVQYFERAVFEYHPEYAGTPYEVELAQLGTLHYHEKYLAPSRTPVPPTATATAILPPPPPTATPIPGPTNTPTDAELCADIPASHNMTVTPPCGTQFTTFRFRATGFMPGERVGVWLTLPDGTPYGAQFQASANGDGIVDRVSLTTNNYAPVGRWAITMEGIVSHAQAIGYFRVLLFRP